jgi:hypothetical protein
MMPEVDEPFGRRRWDPLTKAEQPLTNTVASATSNGQDTPDPSAPPSSDTTS